MDHESAAEAVTAPSTTRSTAPLSAPSGATSAPRDALSPEARLIYDYIVGNSDEFASRDDLTPGARRYYDYLVRGSAPPASATTDVSTNILVRTEVDAVHDAVNDDEIEDIQDAVDFGVADFVASVPTTCSAERPSQAASVDAVTFISFATPHSSTSSIVPELAAPELSDKALDMDVMGDTAPTAAICLPGDHSTGGEDSMDMSLTPGSAPPSFNAPPEDLPSPLSVPMGAVELCLMSVLNKELKVVTEPIETPPSMLTEAYQVFNDVPAATAIVPWPPPSWNPARTPLIRGQDLCHDAQQKRGKELLVSLDSMGNWNAIWLDVELKPPWLPLGVCMDMPIDVCMINTMVSLATWPMEFSNGINSGKRNDTNCAIAQPVLISSEYLDLAIVSVPRMFMDIPFLISADVHQEFVGTYSVTAVLSRLFTLLLVRTAVMLWPFFQFATGNMILLLPWDTGLPLSGMDNKLSTIKHEHVVRLLTASEVNYLQGRLMHSQLSCSLLIDTILKGVVALVQLHSQPSWGLSVWILPLANRATYTLVNRCYLNYTPGSSDLAIPHWVLVNFDSARVQFQWAPAVRKWIYHHILRGNTHCSEQMQWLFSHSLLQFQFCTAFVQSENFWKINLVPLKSWFQCCCDQRESIYSCENLQWTIVWSLSCPFSQSISWSFNFPPWEDVLLPCSTRRVSLSSSEKCQLEIARLLDLVLTEWEPWPYGVYFWAVYVSASACGPVVLFWWLQFSNNSSFNFRDELLCNTTIQIQPWPSCESSSMVLQLTEIEECQPWAHPFGNECGHLHWPCFQPTICHSRFSYGEVYSLVQAEREGWFQFCPPGKASLYSYGTAQFQWAIAWPPTTLAYSIHYRMHMYVTPECSTVICYLEIEIKCVPHMHWDPGGFSRHWLGVKTKFRKFAWLLVGSYLANSKSGRSELVTLRESMPAFNQLMLNVYHTFSPGTPIEVGLLKDVLVQDWLICLNGHIIQCGFEVTQWKITWSFFWENIEFGNQSSHFISAATLTYPVWYLSWDPGIWALLCFCGLFTQVVAKGENMVEAPTYCYYHYSAVFLGQASSATTISSTLCKSTSTTSPTRIIKESHVPWDPGGSTRHRLGVKPNFKKGGLSTTSLLGWLVGRHSWAKVCSGVTRGRNGGAYIPGSQLQGDSAWNGTDGLGLEGEDRLACCVRLLFCVVFFL